MVRFIIIFFNYMYQSKIAIYIPIWLDLLLIKNRLSKFKKRYLHSNMVRFIILIYPVYSTILMHLHSNMVRFIIISPSFSRFKVRFIYIPIWLDLLL